MRIVAATARPLEEMVRQERFRQDLYYRINVIEIDLPPLRERGDDIGLLAEHMAVRYSREMGRTFRGITPEAYQVLAQYRWPGNVRELQNVIRRGIALTKGTMIGVDDLPDEVVVSAGENRAAGEAGFFALREQRLAAFEAEYIRDLLDRHEEECADPERRRGREAPRRHAQTTPPTGNTVPQRICVMVQAKKKNERLRLG